jgi:hypothetical protein
LKDGVYKCIHDIKHQSKQKTIRDEGLFLDVKKIIEKKKFVKYLKINEL